MSKEGEIHKGHRARLRERMLREGLQGFAPHEVLELLLCFAIPQRDVNPLAHTLLKSFGSLSGVLEAAPEELRRCPGVGENAAALLALMPQLTGYYMRDRLRERRRLCTASDAGAYCKTLFFGAANEAVYLICLDAQARVIHPALIRSGTIDEAPLYPREVVETALRHHAHSVLLAHNHPGGDASPSAADYDVTRTVLSALKVIDIRVVDHIIVADTGFFSMAQQDKLVQGAMTNPDQGARQADRATAGGEVYDGFEQPD